jgi:hypothetical protein
MHVTYLSSIYSNEDAPNNQYHRQQKQITTGLLTHFAALLLDKN